VSCSEQHCRHPTDLSLLSCQDCRRTRARRGLPCGVRYRTAGRTRPLPTSVGDLQRSPWVLVWRCQTRPSLGPTQPTAVTLPHETALREVLAPLCTCITLLSASSQPQAQAPASFCIPASTHIAPSALLNQNMLKNPILPSKRNAFPEEKIKR